jgi:cell division protein FtsB
MKLTKQPPKKITLYYEKVFSTWGIGFDFCTNHAKKLEYILLSEYEKELKCELEKLREERQRKYDEIAELKKLLVAMAKRLPIPKNVKMVKM